MASSVLFFLITATTLLAEERSPMVKLSHGLLKGSWKTSLKGRTFASFEGVPYASPPVGKYRFREPQQLNPWLGTWDATKPLSACLQYEALVSKKVLGSEDCLYLNVFTPSPTPDKLLPVVVFIHGGAFLYGEGIANGPFYLMDKDFVIVTINYRLGSLGFLSAGDEVIPGNNGLKDQSAALHWIRNNIRMFGGNPDSITLTGFSVGGASVYYHYLSPMSKGTFHRGIAFSGSPFSPRSYSMKPAQKARALADIVGCPSGTSREILECLSSRPAEVIVKAQIGMGVWKVQVLSPFLPTTEAAGSQNPFLSLYPYHAASTGAIANVSLITTVTSEEGLFPAATYLAEPETLSYLENHWETVANEIFIYNDTLPHDKRTHVAKRIKQHYLGNKPVSQETFPQLVQAMTDRMFVADLGKMAQLHALKTNQPVYVYRFTFRGTTSLTNTLAKNYNNYGVCHGDDVAMIFKKGARTELTDAKDLAMMDALVNMVYSYASTGSGSGHTLELQMSNMVEVNLSYGNLKGMWKTSLKGRPYASFEGVPYASPPVGKYRFREPQPLEPWDGTWDATKPRSACTQYESLIHKDIRGSEDCLFLNVYSPTLTPDKPLPVVVYIHDGGFLYGHGIANGPLFLMDKDVVVVTMNYRLGPLGFLSTGDEVIPGNNGLKDQSAALHWIRNNIRIFGGNPDNVTLAGYSSGAACVYYHYLSPLSRGTFHRGIAFSSSPFSPLAYSVKPAQNAKALASILGCPTGSSQEILDCLNSKPAEVIVKAQIDMFKWILHLLSPFTPTTEAIESQNPFLSQHPYQAASMGAIANFPLLTSITSEEGLFPASVFQAEPNILKYLDDNWDKLASEIFLFNDTLPETERTNVARKIKQHYFENKPVSQETFPQLVEALGDRLSKSGVGKMAQIHALKSNHPVYVYRYSYRGTNSLSSNMTNNLVNYGVCHGDDVTMIFNFKKTSLELIDPKDLPMIDTLVNMVYTYASTGVPTLTESSPKWTPIRPGASEIDYLEIMSPTESEMRNKADFGQCSFWDGLGFNENEGYCVYK